MSALRLAAASLYLVPILLWLVMGWNVRRWTQRVPNLAFLVATLACTHFSVHALFWLMPPGPLPRVLLIANDLSIIAVMTVGRHAVRIVAGDKPPGRRWLVGSYATGLLFAVAVVVLGNVQDLWRLAVLQVFVVASWALMFREGLRVAVRGGWRPGGASFQVRAPDVLLMGATFAAVLGFLGFIFAGTPVVFPSRWAIVLDFVIALSIAVAFAVRMLGEVVRGFLIAVASLLAAGGLYFGAQALRPTFATPEGRMLVDIGTVLALVAVLVPGQAWLRAQIDRAVLGRTLRRRERLQAFLHTLSPEPGVIECCRRALEEVVRVMELRGAAVLLRDGQAVVVGSCALGALEQMWPRDGAIDRSLAGLGLLDLPAPLREAILQTEVAGLAPITSPRQHWGDLFLRTGFLGATFAAEDLHGVGAFAAQLALVLDTADLLARAIGVERSLAHAEKLAAIGETAARIAHEIRNPVTAARSLAQQLVRDPIAAANVEHAGLILTELERVERQVAALLRFSRRDDFHFEAVDLGDLATATVERFRARCEAGGVALEVDARDGVIARADREKLRQVLVNLVENALDALGDAAGPRTLAVTVGNGNGVATCGVRDTGPGVPADVLARLFEPFYTSKDNGTGLGLAIAKRTIDAHDGRIIATSRVGEGTTFAIELPLASA
jgi:signal transduction histidine kinase